MELLKINSVSKSIKNKPILNDINMHIESGKVIGLVGPNGSGKTTLLKLIAGIIKPNSGTILLNNQHVGVHTKSSIAYLADANYISPYKSVLDAKCLFTSLFDDFDDNDFEDLINLSKISDKDILGNLSKGMSELLYLSLTLSRKTKLTILDEPLGGLDPVIREQVLKSIIRKSGGERTIIIASHLVHEIEQALEYVYFLKSGEIITSSSTEDIRINYQQSLDDFYKEAFKC